MYQQQQQQQQYQQQQYQQGGGYAGYSGYGTPAAPAAAPAAVPPALPDALAGIPEEQKVGLSVDCVAFFWSVSQPLFKLIPPWVSALFGVPPFLPLSVSGTAIKCVSNPTLFI